jgi:hypothetical protein
MGLSMAVGSIFRDPQWAHMRPMAAFHQKYNRPTQCYWQHLLGEVVGLSMAVGSIFWDPQWAHMRPSAAFLRRSYGPIHGCREYFSGPTMGPHEANGSISSEIQQAHSMLLAASLRRSCGPIHDCREYFQDSQWAHMRPSAAFHWRYSRAIQCYRQHLLGEAMGLFMTFGNILQQQY